jgi:hypothetical protein
LLASEGWAKRKKAIPIEDAIKKYEGVYVNTEYEGNDYQRHPQKRIIYSDGKMEVYPKTTGNFSYKTEYSIEESWSDSNGAIYSKVIVKWRHGSNTSLELWKLDTKGDVFEVNFNFYFLYEDVNKEYPTKIDPNSETFPRSFYNIYIKRLLAESSGKISYVKLITENHDIINVFL